MRSIRHHVLVVDDDPSHLEIYGLLLKQTGYEPVPALVRFTGAEFPEDAEVAAIILDYRLNSLRSSAELARQLVEIYPHAPIILLSDLGDAPLDIAPYVADSVSRGEPAQLLQKLSSLISDTVPLAAGPLLSDHDFIPCGSTV